MDAVPSTPSTRPHQSRRQTAKRMLFAAIQKTKTLLHEITHHPSTSKGNRLSAAESPRRNASSSKHRTNPQFQSTRYYDHASTASSSSYSVASASQLNGRYVEHALWNANHSPPTRSQSQRTRAPLTPMYPNLNVLVTRSKSTPHLTSFMTSTNSLTSSWQREYDERTDSPQPYSPQLSTIAEQTEPDTSIRPLSEVLSIGEAQLCPIQALNAAFTAPLIHASFSNPESAISRFAAKATHLIHTLGPLLEIYGRSEMEILRAQGYGDEHFRPLVSKLFSRVCVCDVNLPGEAIKLSSSGFEIGAAGLVVGGCSYLNLEEGNDGVVGEEGRWKGRRSHHGHAIRLRTECAPLTHSRRYILHFAMPLCDKALKRHYTLVAQVDITDPLRRLALSERESNSTTPATPSRTPDASPSNTRNRKDYTPPALSQQMRRFLSFVYWLASFHSHALCFTRESVPTNAGHDQAHAEEGKEWTLRLASPHVFSEGEWMRPSLSSAAEADHMSCMMDGEDAFVQSVACGGSGDLGTIHADHQDGTETAAKTYMQYCVPVMDGRDAGDRRREKWWVSWLVNRQVPGFWGRRVNVSEDDASVLVEYPFLV